MAHVEHRTAEHVAGDLRDRIGRGIWRPEQMLPGRRALAAEYEVALPTLERAVAVLMSEGLLRADPRRGTFVASTLSGAGNPVEPSVSALSREPLPATVVIVASMMSHWGDDITQWPRLILRACEDYFGTVAGVTTRFVNAKASDSPSRSSQEILEEIQDCSPDAVLLINLHQELTSLLEVPHVSIVFDPLPGAFRQVTIDEPYGGLHAARHLLNQGYQRLLFFHPFTINWVEGRLAGVRTASERAPSVAFEVWPEAPVLLPATTLADKQSTLAQEAAQALFERGFERGTGVIAPNDTTAVAFMRVASARGFEAGVDYGIIGFDDYERDADLSTMRVPLEQMGLESARMVERVLRGESGPSRVMLHHRLIPRGSTRRRVEAANG